MMSSVMTGEWKEEGYDEEKVDNNDKNADDGDGSCCTDDEEDDEETLARMSAFKRSSDHNAFKQQSHGRNMVTTKSTGKTTTTTVKIHRFDEKTDFISRSMRSSTRSEQQDGALLENILKSKRSSSSSKPAVYFRDPVELTVHEIPEWTDEEKNRMFLGGEVWDAIDLDVNLTKKRWENHLDGSIPFDKENNTTRGLEKIILDEVDQIREHHHAIFVEMNRQKEDGSYLDWTSLAKISQETSEQDLERAKERADTDVVESKEAWEPRKAESSSSSPEKDKKKKKRKSGFGRFVSSLKKSLSSSNLNNGK